MTKGSLGLIAVVSLMASPLFTPALAATPKVVQATGAPKIPQGCVQVAHAGGGARPVGSVRLCPGKKAKRDFQSALENKWGFQFDPGTFARLRELIEHEKHEPTPSGILPPGTFSVSWHDYGKETTGDYTLEPAKSCAFLGELAQAVPAKDYAEFVRVLGDLKGRAKCAATTPAPPAAPK